MNTKQLRTVRHNKTEEKEMNDQEARRLRSIRTQIINLNKSLKAPELYTAESEIEGMLSCYEMYLKLRAN